MNRSTVGRASALLTALALLVTACGDDDGGEEGAAPTAGGGTDTECDFEGDEIRVGTQVATGPAVGEQFLDFVPGVRARLEMENEAGGIDGRTFTIVEREAQLDPTAVSQN